MLPFIKNKKGFTLIELLVVIAILSILLVIVLVAINPARQTQKARNTQRRADVLTILNAVNQYFVDEASFPSGPYSTCPATDAIGSAGGDGGDGDVTLAPIVPAYVAAIPVDPGTGFDQANTGYTICESASDRITVYAPESLNDGETTTISATR